MVQYYATECFKTNNLFSDNLLKNIGIDNASAVWNFNVSINYFCNPHLQSKINVTSFTDTEE